MADEEVDEGAQSGYFGFAVWVGQRGVHVIRNCGPLARMMLALVLTLATVVGFGAVGCASGDRVEGESPLARDASQRNRARSAAETVSGDSEAKCEDSIASSLGGLRPFGFDTAVKEVEVGFHLVPILTHAKSESALDDDAVAIERGTMNGKMVWEPLGGGQIRFKVDAEFYGCDPNVLSVRLLGSNGNSVSVEGAHHRRTVWQKPGRPLVRWESGEWHTMTIGARLPGIAVCFELEVGDESMESATVCMMAPWSLFGDQGGEAKLDNDGESAISSGWQEGVYRMCGEHLPGRAYSCCEPDSCTFSIECSEKEGFGGAGVPARMQLKLLAFDEGLVALEVVCPDVERGEGGPKDMLEGVELRLGSSYDELFDPLAAVGSALVRSESTMELKQGMRYADQRRSSSARFAFRVHQISESIVLGIGSSGEFRLIEIPVELLEANGSGF